MEKLFFIYVFICLILSFLYKSNNQRDIFLLRTALMFTVIADFFMLIAHNVLFGLLFFCCVHYVYTSRYSCHKFIMPLIITQSALFAILIFVKVKFIYILAVLYAVSFVFSLFSLKYYMGNPLISLRCKMMSVAGMLLFLACDINVGLYNLFFLPINYILTWVFYLPSQLLLSLSANYKE